MFISIFNNILLAGIFFLLLSSCSATLPSNINKKFSADEIREDIDVLRTTYYEAHPSLFWYTPKDSIDLYFNKAYALIKDSMTETDLYRLLSYTISPIHCGHTTVKYSKQTSHFNQPDRSPHIPIEIRYVGDTALVTLLYRRSDSVLKFGTEIRSINHIPVTVIRDSAFLFMSSDGYNKTVKYSRLNANFSGYHRLVYGLSDRYEIEYVNESGQNTFITLPLYEPQNDTTLRNQPRTQRLPPAATREIDRFRRLLIDSANNTAILSIATFENKAHLVRFIKKSFRSLRKQAISNLIIDIRNNGGGNVSRSALLGRYIAKRPFKICDSAFSVKRSGFSYPGRIQNFFFYWLMMNIVTTRKKDGKFHFGYLEHHYFKPKKRNHFSGNVYVLTSGATFSASTLFINHVKGQDNVKIVGDETGGGYYGSSAINTPDLTLPNTRIRLRLPLYRLVMDKNRPKTGRGFFPDYSVPVTTYSLRNRIDIKMEFVKKQIAEKKK
jgi:hypothetical protein